jgi:hypothetical protein
VARGEGETPAGPLFVEVRAVSLGVVRGQPPTKTEPNSKFISSVDSEPNPTGINYGRPVNPIGTGRKINLWGEQETPGFEDYSPDLPYSGYKRAWNQDKWLFRPWTEDPDPAVGVGSGTASDICIRGSPPTDDTIRAIRRMAKAGCRLTYSGDKKRKELLANGMKGAHILEEFDDEIVMELP